jgi:Yip1 domain
MASPVTPSPESAPSVSSVGRIFGVIFSPKPTFESIVKRPDWLAPLIVLTLLGFVMSSVLAQRADWREIVRTQLEQSGRLDKIPQDKREDTLDKGAVFAKYVTYAAGLVGTTLAFLISAGIYLGAFNLIFGVGLNFKTAFSVVSYASVPGGLRSILGIFILFLKDPSTINPNNFVASNVAAFLSTDSPKWLMTLGAFLDVFAFWSLILTAIGFSAANPKKIKLGTALGVVIGVYVIIMLLFVGLASLS